MNKKYSDSEGNIVECFQLNGPIVLTTVSGEKSGSENDWVILLPSNQVAILDNDNFIISFTEIKE